MSAEEVLANIRAAVEAKAIQREQRKHWMRGMALWVGSVSEVAACACAYGIDGWKAVGVVTFAILALECGFYRRLTEER